MGIDGSFIVEFYDRVDGTWKLMVWNNISAHYEPISVCSIEQCRNETDDEYEERLEQYVDSFPTESFKRNYKLLALLANICNEEDIIPISDVRGLPRDISASALNVINHSSEEDKCTWHDLETIQDLLKYDMIRPNGILHRDYLKGDFNDFIDTIHTIENGIGERYSQARFIMFFG